ncbi:hypothetical protein RQP46_007692 [Phenoliferia psychrophenolica]
MAEAELESLRSSATHYRLTSEQALHDAATRLAEAEQALESERAQSSRVVSEQAALKQRVGELEKELEAERQRRRDEEANERASGDKEREREREARDLLDALERSRTDKDDVERQLGSLRALHTALQASHSTLESSLLDATTTSRSTLLRLETATSTITSLSSTKEFLTTELSLARTELSTSRRSSLEQLSTLQAQLDSAELEARTSSAALADLRDKYSQLTKRHEDVAQELQRAKEELAVREGQFMGEMGSMRRVVESLEKREEQRKARLEEVELGVDDERRARDDREQELVQDLQDERERADQLERRCHELVEAVERGKANFSGHLDGDSPGGGSSFALSPEASLAVRGQKKGRSYAEIYAEYVRMQEDLIKERSESKRLGECLNQILVDIEERAPVLKEQREEYDRLSVEATSLANQLADAVTSREAAERRSSALQLDIARLESEAAISSSNLGDLGRQVRKLLRQQAGPSVAGNPDDFDETEAEILARGELMDMDSVVSAHLVTFSDINSLQVQNQKLLKITRDLGSQMERKDELNVARARVEENVAIEEAHNMILRLKEDGESQRATNAAIVRERDMLRRMVDATVNGSSALANGHRPDGEGSSVPGGTEGGRIGDVQASFEAYRTEMAVDTQRLREDLTAAQRDAGVARTELAKSKAQAEFTSERLRLLNESYELQKGELSQMSKRSLQLQQNNARQDMATHKMTEELSELRSATNQLRHESNNLRSEREVWKSVETRLIDENASLAKERAHLADLFENLQTMQSEVERSGIDSRRRLEEHITRLEAQISELKERVAQETDAGRQLALRKELEGKAFQDRIDRLTTDHQETREQLIAAQTSKDHLDQRISDLNFQLAAKEEKLSVYEGRGTGSDNPERTREEQLEASVAELRTELRVVKGALERANANVQQFQAIAETEGDSLRQITATYDEYKASTDGLVAEKDVEISGLRERLHSLTTDLTAASTQNSDLHRQIETQRTTFEKERKALEDNMVDLRAADQGAREAQLAAQDDLRRQAQLAKEAHEKYDRELVAHADDVKRLTEIKTELDEVRKTIQEHQTGGEVAKANLVASEASWSRQKSALEQEISDLHKRTSDLNAQNKVLHTHLESIGAQATRLQQERAKAGADGTPAPADENGSSDSATVSQLREVIGYLRSEKDVAEFKLEFSKQEAARLEHQLELSNRSLNEARQALTEERHKAGESNVSTAQHAELLERIHTAKLLRESNQTLRDENEANLRRVTQLDARLQQALAELDPLKETVHALTAEIESKDNNLRLLEEDNERWKVRNQTILSNYERIDPEELQSLKDEVAVLKTRIVEVEAEKAALETKLAEALGQVDNHKSRFIRLQDMARKEREDNKKTVAAKAALEEALAAAQAAVPAPAQSDPLDKERLESQAASFLEEKAALEARLAEEKLAIEARAAEEKSALEAKLAEESTQRLAQAEFVERQTAEFAAMTAEKIRLEKRERPIFEDNKRLKALERTNAETMAKLKKDFEEANADAIAQAVESRVALLPPPPPTPEAAAVEETIAKRVALAEETFKAERDSAIASAVATATAKLQTDLAAAQAELAAKPTLPASDGPAPAADPAELAKLQTEFETAKEAMRTEFEQVKLKLNEEAKAREVEITTRLTAEIAKAHEASSKPSSDSTPAPPPVDVDALVQAKLAEHEKERSASQDQAISAAVEAAVAKLQVAHVAALEAQKVAVVKEFSLQKTLLTSQNQKLKAELAKNKPAATPVASTSATPLPPLVATTGPAIAARLGTPGTTPTPGGPRGGRGRGTERGGRGGAAPGRGGAAAAAATPGRGGAAGASLSLRGVAAGAAPRGGRGGILGAILGAAQPKRARDDDSTPESKRVKQDEKSDV